MRLKLTREGARYSNQLEDKYQKSILSSKETNDLNVLAWASKGYRSKYPLDPDKLKVQANREAVRRLFEAGYLEIIEE